MLNEQLLAGILAAAPDPIIVVDGAGKIVLVNDETLRCFGFEREALVGQPIECLVPERFASQHRLDRGQFAQSPHRRPMGIGLELTARRKDGTEFPVEISLSPMVANGETLVIAAVRDLTARKQADERLRYLTYHDVLTGLYNRSYFEEELARLGRGRKSPIGVLAMDVDGLKVVNDSMGHAAGDALLRRVGEVLRSVLRGEEVAARTGGDEFVVLLPQVSEAQLLAVRERLEHALREHNREVKSPVLSLTIGAATQREGESLEETLRRADASLYEGKRGRRSIAPG